MSSMFRLARLVPAVLMLVAFALVACQPPAATSDGDNTDIQIALQPMHPEETMVVILTGADGEPITDATVALEGNMNHAGMIPVLAEATADDADGSADGRYHLPFTFTMLGDWIITVTVERADGSSFSRNLDVRASETGIEGDTVMPASDAPATDHDATDHDANEHDTGDHGGDAHDSSTESHLSTIHIYNVMARPAPLAGGNGAIYFAMHNGGDASVRLIGGESPAAEAVEIHTTENDNGVMRMRQLEDGIELGPDEAAELQPGGMHLMLIGLTEPLAEGDTVELTLHFEGADDLSISVPVMAMDDMPTEGEAEHADH